MLNSLAVEALKPVPAVEGPAPHIEVEIVTTDGGFAALASSWNDLHERAAGSSVFNSWTWQYHWWQMYGQDRPLCILVAKILADVVGILPLYLHTARILGVRTRIARLVGTGGDTHPDDLGPVLSAAHEESVASALARAALALPEQDLLLITDLERRSVFARALERDARHLGVAGAIEPAQTISYATLPATWALFVAQLRANRRSKLRKQRARLAEQGARFFVWEAAAELDRAVDRLTTLHRMRWAASGASASFSSRQYVEFHRMIIKACFPRGWLRLYCLEIAGEIVGITYCYRFRNRIYLMQAGFDPAWAKLNPGAVLLGYALEHAIGEGNEVFDFLRGRHRYKDELATGTRETVSARYWRPTLGALAYRARHIWLPHWKAQIRSGKSQSLTLKSPTHRVVKNVENPVISSPAICTPGANTTFLKKQPGTPPARPAIFLLGPSLGAVSGVSTHVDLILRSPALERDFALEHFQVGSEGRAENFLSKALRFASSPFRLAAKILRHDFAIVHVNTSMELRSYWRDLAYISAAKLCGASVVYQIHGGSLPLEFFAGSRVLTAFLRWTLHWPEVVVVLAKIEEKAYRAFVSRQNVALVPNGIDCQPFLRQQRGPSDAKSPLGFPGSRRAPP